MSDPKRCDALMPEDMGTTAYGYCRRIKGHQDNHMSEPYYAVNADLAAARARVEMLEGALREIAGLLGGHDCTCVELAREALGKGRRK